MSVGNFSEAMNDKYPKTLVVHFALGDRRVRSDRYDFTCEKELRDFFACDHIFHPPIEINRIWYTWKQP